MDLPILQKHCAALLEQLAVPGVIVLALQDGSQVKVVRAQKDMSQLAIIKALSWALNDSIQSIIIQEERG